MGSSNVFGAIFAIAGTTFFSIAKMPQKETKFVFQNKMSASAAMLSVRFDHDTDWFNEPNQIMNDSKITRNMTYGGLGHH